VARAIKSIRSGPQSVLERLGEVLEVFDDLVEQIDTVGLAVDDIKQTLGDLAREKPDLNALLLPVKGKRPRGTDATSQAPAYARSVHVKWGLNSAVAHIDGQSIALTPRLGSLLGLLVAQDGDLPANAGHGWKTREELALRLGRHNGKPVTRHALENLISRLKKELRQQAGLEAFVQCDRRLGVRFALQRYAAAPVDDPGGMEEPQFRFDAEPVNTDAP
jgi:hypothetical protein